MPRRSVINYRLRQRIRATAKYIYNKSSRNPDPRYYTRVRRGLYRRPYNAYNWVRMMRHPYWRNRLRGRRSRNRNWDEYNNIYKRLPRDLQIHINRFLGNSPLGALMSWE